MKRILVAAMDQKGGIGYKGKLPWHIPADLKFFKQLTWQHPILMGRKTFESLPKLLPERYHVVVSKSLQPKQNKQLVICQTIESALAFAEHYAKNHQKENIFIIGGRSIFEYFLKNHLLDGMWITHIESVYQSDTFFPAWDKQLWKKTQEVIHPPEGDYPLLRFCYYEPL